MGEDLKRQLPKEHAKWPASLWEGSDIKSHQGSANQTTASHCVTPRGQLRSDRWDLLERMLRNGNPPLWLMVRPS